MRSAHDSLNLASFSARENVDLVSDKILPQHAWMIATAPPKEEAGLIRAIGVPALTANIISSTIGAGIFVIPATVAGGLGPAAPLAFVCCAIAMVLFVTCFAIAGSRVSLTGGLYAYVEVAFGKYVGFLAGVLYFLTALGAVAGVVNVLANPVALVVLFFCICAGLFFIHAPNLSWGAWPGSKALGDSVILLIFAFVGIEVALIPSG